MDAIVSCIFNARESHRGIAMIVIVSQKLGRFPSLGVQIELFRFDGVMRLQKQIKHADPQYGTDMRADEKYPKPVVASEAGQKSRFAIVKKWKSTFTAKVSEIT